MAGKLRDFPGRTKCRFTLNPTDLRRPKRRLHRIPPMGHHRDRLAWANLKILAATRPDIAKALEILAKPAAGRSL